MGNFDKSTRSGKERDRRMFQKMSAGVGGFIFGDGIDYDPGTGLVSVSLATPSGLEFLTGDLRIDLNGTSLTLGVLGLSVTAPEGLWTVTAVKTGAYGAAIGEFVKCDPSGAGFTVTLPTAVGNTGRAICVKNVTASTNAITIATTGGQTIDGSATASIAVGSGSLTFVSDGTGWYIE